MAAKIYAKEAIIERFTYSPEETYEEHIQRVCSVSYEDYCTQYKIEIENLYADIPKPISCEIIFIEPVAYIKFPQLNKKGMSIRVSINILNDDEDLVEHTESVLLMIKDHEWKIMDVVSHEEYAEQIRSQ